MLDATVVPECNRVRLPLEADAELGRLDVAIEHLKDCVALVLPQADDARRECAVDEQALFPGDWMGPNNRMFGAGKCLAGIINPVSPTIDVLAVMNRAQSVDQLSDRL